MLKIKKKTVQEDKKSQGLQPNPGLQLNLGLKRHKCQDRHQDLPHDLSRDQENQAEIDQQNENENQDLDRGAEVRDRQLKKVVGN